MNYVDANVLIYSLVDTTEKGAGCRRLLDSERLVTCVLSLDEVAYKIGKKSPAEAVKAIDGIRKLTNLVLIAFLPEDVDTFVEYLSQGFKPRDAIHAACAKKVHATTIYSEDSDFDKLPIKRKTPW